MQHKIPCPSCNSANIIRKGKRKNKLQTLQRYECKDCQKAFISQHIPNKTYPASVILNALSCYNLGHTQQQVSAILTRRYKIEIPQRTISDWLNHYKSICTYSKLRPETVKLYSPREIIFSQRLEHNQVYNFKYHKAKLHLISRSQPYNKAVNMNKYYIPLKQYLDKIPTKEFPHHLFQNSKTTNENNSPKDNPQQRASQLKFSHIKITPFSKTNLANKLTALALILAKTNAQRHEAVQSFMLVNDSTTIAAEVPVYLTKDDIRYYAKALNSNSAKELLKHPTPITGHIDLLQFRNNLLHILDYKPEANKTNPVQQLTTYALALASRTRLNLKSMKCAWFDQNNYYEFYPLNAVYSMTENRKRLASLRY